MQNTNVPFCTIMPIISLYTFVIILSDNSHNYLSGLYPNLFPTGSSISHKKKKNQSVTSQSVGIHDSVDVGDELTYDDDNDDVFGNSPLFFSVFELILSLF